MGRCESINSKQRDGVFNPNTGRQVRVAAIFAPNTEVDAAVTSAKNVLPKWSIINPRHRRGREKTSQNYMPSCA